MLCFAAHHGAVLAGPVGAGGILSERRLAPSLSTPAENGVEQLWGLRYRAVLRARTAVWETDREQSIVRSSLG